MLSETQNSTIKIDSSEISYIFTSAKWLLDGLFASGKNDTGNKLPEQQPIQINKIPLQLDAVSSYKEKKKNIKKIFINLTYIICNRYV